MRRLAAGVMLLGVMLACGQASQGAQIKDLMSGRTYPLTLQLKDLNGEWRRFTPSGQGEAGVLTMIYAMILGRGGGGVYYTKGKVVVAGTERYLVAYSRRTRPANMRAILESGPGAVEPEELTPESPVTLSLLNLRTIGSLVDIRPFNLEDELTAASEFAAAAAEAGGRGAGGPAEAESLTNLKNLALAVQMYLADYDDTLPDLSSPLIAMDELTDYVKDESMFYHPRTGGPYAVNAALSGRRLVELGEPSAIAVYYEETAAEDKTRGVAFLDGHAARVTDAKWQQIRAASGIAAPETTEARD